MNLRNWSNLTPDIMHASSLISYEARLVQRLSVKKKPTLGEGACS